MNIVHVYIIICVILTIIAVLLIYRTANAGNRKLADRIGYGFLGVIAILATITIAIILIRPGKDEYVKDGTFFLIYEHEGVYYDHLVKVQKYKTVATFWQPCTIEKTELIETNIKYEEK